MLQFAQELRRIITETTPLLEKISDETASAKPSPDNWSTKEVIGHLIDSAANNHQRFVRLQHNETLDFPKYEQDAWVSGQHYNKSDWKSMIALWKYYNLHLAFIMEHMPSGNLQRTVFIGDSKPFSLEFIIKDYVEHLKHHLKSIFSENGHQ